MADITISELELTDNILDDMTIPVETPSKTFSATLKQLKNYIGGDLPLGSIIPNVGVLNDERFTLLDGKNLASNGTYAEFYRKAVENITNGYWVQCTEEEFNSDVSNYGSCGKFVVTDEYIRIPKITKFIGATNILSEIGDTLRGDVPSQNITVQSGTGATVKALASDLKNTQSTHTKYYYYMKVSTEGQKEPIEIDINKVYEDLEIKANTSLSNLTAEGKSLASGLGMLSDKYVGLTLGASGTTYTAPANGWFYLSKTAGKTDAYISLVINGAFGQTIHVPGAGNQNRTFIPARKGDTLTVTYSATGETSAFRFYYAEGEN